MDNNIDKTMWENINMEDINLINNKINELNKKTHDKFKKNNSQNYPININDYFIYKQLKYTYLLKYNLLKFYYTLGFMNYYKYLNLINNRTEKKIKKIKSL